MVKEFDELMEILSSIQARLENKTNKDKKESELLAYVEDRQEKGKVLKNTNQ